MLNLEKKIKVKLEIHRSQLEATKIENSLKEEIKTVKFQMDKIKCENSMLTEETMCLSKNKKILIKERHLEEKASDLDLLKEMDKTLGLQDDLNPFNLSQIETIEEASKF